MRDNRIFAQRPRENTMKQLSLTDNFEKHRKKTRKEQFLEDMDRIIPWQGLVEAVTPFYPNPQGAGRRPVGIERMLRIYFLQHWFQLSNKGDGGIKNSPRAILCEIYHLRSLFRKECESVPIHPLKTISAHARFSTLCMSLKMQFYR